MRWFEFDFLQWTIEMAEEIPTGKICWKVQRQLMSIALRSWEWKKRDEENWWSWPLHPGRLTWNIIMEVWKIIFLSKWVIYRFHVNLPGCRWFRVSFGNIFGYGSGFPAENTFFLFGTRRRYPAKVDGRNPTQDMSIWANFFGVHSTVDERHPDTSWCGKHPFKIDLIAPLCDFGRIPQLSLHSKKIKQSKEWISFRSSVIFLSLATWFMSWPMVSLCHFHAYKYKYIHTHINT